MIVLWVDLFHIYWRSFDPTKTWPPWAWLIFTKYHIVKLLKSSSPKWLNFIIICHECSLGGPLSDSLKKFWYDKKHGRLLGWAIKGHHGPLVVFFNQIFRRKNMVIRLANVVERAGVNNSSVCNFSYIFQRILTKLSHNYCNQVPQRILSFFFSIRSFFTELRPFVSFAHM